MRTSPDRPVAVGPRPGSPRFSVVLPVRDDADVVGRAVASVLAQTFADLELLVIDVGSADRTLDAVRAVADERVSIVDAAARQVPPDEAGDDHGRSPYVDALAAARGRWATIISADAEVDSAWLARIGRLADATGAGFVSCGGRQHDRRGTVTEFRPVDPGAGPVACLRAGAFATSTDRLRAAVELIGPELAPTRDRAEDGGPPEPELAGHFGRAALDLAVLDGAVVIHSPELLLSWYDQDEPGTGVDRPRSDDELQLHLAFQGLDALARTPIPDGELLARYATFGGLAAARMQQGRDARRLFRIACRARPEVRDHWTRLLAAHLGPLGQRMVAGAPVAG
ncbi:glycosyltransferase family 2 protein [Dermatobacter hominis]|uniref:glycosyltransferase family 2 protein n=1 Tax=Dermatobacter hominis TaxID=2884263 RepID=UPI001D1168BC|nr:glycosyltransferase [Dermatobacter hominis]UDY34633.1 glycosyltransferase [Dermatobacter hominis]